MRDCPCWFVGRHWFMIALTSGFHVIRAAAPCWKGEVQVGRFVFGWED